MLLSIAGLDIAQFYAVVNCWPWYCTILGRYKFLALILRNFMLLLIAGLDIAQFYAVINCWPWYCTILCCYQLLALILHNFMLLSIAGLDIAQFSSIFMIPASADNSVVFVIHYVSKDPVLVSRYRPKFFSLLRKCKHTSWRKQLGRWVLCHRV